MVMLHLEMSVIMRRPPFTVYLVLSAVVRNADHPLDHMSDSVLAKYFISHLISVLLLHSTIVLEEF